MPESPGITIKITPEFDFTNMHGQLKDKITSFFKSELIHAAYALIGRECPECPSKT